MIDQICYLNEQGNRKNLEDSLFPEPGTATFRDRVFLVCDGVGGEAKGEVASKMVCDEFGQQLTQLKTFSKEAIQQCGQIAQNALWSYAQQHTEARKMSTTVTLACFDEKGIWVGWCGDSRVYHIRNGQVLWKSKDHSFVQSLVNIGQLTEDEARYHEKRNIILKSFSAQNENADVELHRLTDVHTGDYLLLCTDGLLEQITEGLLFQLLNEEQTEQDKAALFNQYCTGKTNDNYSMYLLEVNYRAIPKEVRKTEEPKATLLRKWVVAVLIIVAIFFSLYVLFNFKRNEKPEALPKINSIDTTETKNNTELPQLVKLPEISKSKIPKEKDVTNKASLPKKTERNKDSLYKEKRSTGSEKGTDSLLKKRKDTLY